MSIGNLNKTVTYIVTGAVVIFNFLVLNTLFFKLTLSAPLYDLLKKIRKSESFLTIILISCCFLVGVLFEIPIRTMWFKKYMASSEWRFFTKNRLSFFFDKSQIESYIYFRDQTKLLTSNKFVNISQGTRNRYPKEFVTHDGIATTLLFELSSAETRSWVISHYSTYMLLWRFYILALIDALILACNFHFWWSFLFFILTLVLFQRMLDKYTYVYGFIFRFITMKLNGDLNFRTDFETVLSDESGDNIDIIQPS